MESNEIKVVKKFVQAINDGDVSKISQLMADDHLFIDSGGRRETGHDKMIAGWKEYFKMFPDYKVQVDDILQRGNMVALFGSTSAIYNGKRGLVPENKVGGPAAWKAIIEDNKIKVWQVYTDWTEDMKVIEADNNYVL